MKNLNIGLDLYCPKCSKEVVISNNKPNIYWCNNCSIEPMYVEGREVRDAKNEREVEDAG